MGYTIENKQDTAAQSVLLTTEKSFVASSGIDKSNNTQANTKVSTEVYFQIED
jgi:hypothetical protein